MTTVVESLYVVLGVEQDASPQEIKQAYRKAALRTHPDRALPDQKAEAETNFKRVAEAYEILSEPDRRRRYDMYGTPGSPPPRSPASSSTGPPSHTYFGTSPDAKPFTFQWESSYDSAKRAQSQRGNGSRRPFGMDPFELFNQMFEADLAGAQTGRGLFDHHPFFSTHHRMMSPDSPLAARSGDPFGPFGPVTQQPASLHSFGGGLAGFPSTIAPSMMSPLLHSSMMRSGGSGFGGGGGSFSSFPCESVQTRTVNGRTETIIRRTDEYGNESVFRQTSH